MYITTNQSYFSTAVLERNITVQEHSYLQFYYHMYGNVDMGDLNVYVDSVRVFKRSGRIGRSWNEVKVYLNGTGTHLVIFTVCL
jgi:hypothetical protein